MAQMLPETLEGVDVQSPAERLLYEKFSQQLSDHFTVIYSVAWLNKLSQNKPPSDGEADFVILHPKMGILVIEVKGGQIGYSAETDWYSVRKDGRTVEIKDPFDQVRRNKYALRDKIQSLPNWQGSYPTIGHAVAFPDGTIDISDLNPDIDDDIILTHADLPNLESWVRSCLKYFAGDKFVAPGEAGLVILRRLLRKSWLMREPKLGESVGVGKAAINYYTEEQFRLLDWISGHRTAAIKGCAGSGKTVLAIEKAQRLADEGFKVLLTCFNRGLSESLKDSSKKFPNLTVINFHGLCAKYAAGTGFIDSDEWDSSHNDFFTDIMPEALAKAVDTGKKEYLFDAIIVDEGQDFKESWWIALEMLLVNRDDGIFYIFYDDNQLVYSHRLSIPFSGSPFTLGKNCRNTLQIHDFISSYYESENKVSSSGLSGPEIAFHPYDGTEKALRVLLTDIFSRLVFKEEVDTGDIVLLSPLGSEKYPMSEIPMVGAFQVVDNQRNQPREIYATSIRLFKGLESSVVVLLLDPESVINDELIYVGASRAEYHLEIVYNQSMVLDNK